MRFLKTVWKNGFVRAFAISSVLINLVSNLIPSTGDRIRLVLASITFCCFLGIFIVSELFRRNKFLSNEDLDHYDLGLLRVEKHNEALAKQANVVAKNNFGKNMGFNYQTYRKYRNKNNSIFAAFVTQSGAMIGFLDVFPLTDEAGAGLLAGELAESELRLEHLLPEAQNADSNYVHIASLVCCYPSTFAKAVVEAIAVSYVMKTFPPAALRYYTAVGTTDDGRRVLNRMKFEKYLAEEFAPNHKAIYRLSSLESAKNRKLVARQMSALLHPKV